MPKGATFENERVALSGERFERCIFRNCELVFDGWPAQLIECRTENCQWSFRGAAGQTMAVLATLCQTYPEFAIQLGRQLGIVNEKVH